MDNHFQFCYVWGHETSGQSTAAGKAPPESDRVAVLGRDLSEGGLGCEVVGELSSTVAPSLSAERKARLAHQTDSGAAGSADAGPNSNANELPGRRRPGGGICHGPLDVAPSVGSDREAVRRALRTDWCPAVAASTIGMDLAKTGAPGDGAQRGGDCQMETGRLARYKKTPISSGLIWSSSTKAASWSPRTSERPGRQSVRPRSFAIAIGTIGSRSSPRSRSPRPVSGSACISAATGTT